MFLAKVKVSILTSFLASSTTCRYVWERERIDEGGWHCSLPLVGKEKEDRRQKTSFNVFSIYIRIHRYYLFRCHRRKLLDWSRSMTIVHISARRQILASIFIVMGHHLLLTIGCIRFSPRSISISHVSAWDMTETLVATVLFSFSQNKNSCSHAHLRAGANTVILM